MAVTRADGVHFDAKMAGADLSNSLNRFCKVQTDGRIVLCAAGQDPAGIITEGATTDNPVTFQHSGLGKVIAGAAIAAGARVMCDANAAAITATAGNVSAGICRNGTAGAGELAEVQFDRTGVV
jgi:hypothetical protein